MEALTPIRMTLSSKPDTYSGATIWNSSKWSVEAAFTELPRDLQSTDPLTKTSLTSKT